MVRIKSIDEIGRRYGRGVREKSPRECIVAYLERKQEMPWLLGMLRHIGILGDKDKIERIIRSLESTYSENPRLKPLMELLYP